MTPPKSDYETFISQAIDGEKVFGLLDETDAWAVCPSAADEMVDVVLFWSDRAEAAKHTIAEWSTHRVSEVSLELFVGTLLRGMHEDGDLVGPNWNAQLDGIEVAAIDMAKRFSELSSDAV